jgi:hypothetical protein
LPPINDATEVEYILSCSKDKKVYTMKVQCEEPLTHGEFLLALRTYLDEELMETAEGESH